MKKYYFTLLILTISFFSSAQAPEAEDDNYNTPVNTELTGNVTDNDSDPNGDTLIVTDFYIDGTKYSAGSNVNISGVGDFILNSDGSFTFDPNGSFSGDVPEITYTVSDGNDSVTATIYITVGDPNNPPQVYDETKETPINITLQEDAPGLLSNDADPDGDPIYISDFTVNGNTYSEGTTVHLVEGDITINDDGSYIFIPATDYTGSVPTITYTVTDGDLSTDGTLDITVIPNGPPTLEDDTAITTEGVSINSGTPGVLGNDSDPDGDTLTVTSFEVNGHDYTPGTTVYLSEGDLTINEDGSYTFVPSSGFTGYVPDVTYTATDGYYTDTAVLSIVVDVTDPSPNMYISTCNQGYTSTGVYKIYYNVYIFNPSYAYGSENLQIYDDLNAVFGNGCITYVDRLWLGSGNTYPGSTDPAMYNGGSWDTEEFDELDPTPGREGLLNQETVDANTLYPRQYITLGFCISVDPSCAGGAGTGSGNGVTFDNILEVQGSTGDTTEHLSISDFHTSETTVAGGIYVPNDPVINGDGTYDFDLVVTIANDGNATANDVQFLLPLYELTQNNIPINSVSITQISGPTLTTNANYDPADVSGTNTGILAAGSSIPANTSVQFNIHYNVGPTSFSGYCEFHAPNPSMTQGNADLITPPGGYVENAAEESYVIWSDALGDHLDRYYPLEDSATNPSSDDQCTCELNGINFNYGINLEVDKTIIEDVPAASDLRGNRDITFEITITNSDTSDVQVENPVLTDNLADICEASHIIQIINPPTIVSSSALSDPNINPSYDGISDTNIFDNASGILQPGESVTLRFTVEFDDPCFGINYAVFGGSDPSGDSTGSTQSGVEVTVYPDFDNDKLPDNVDIDDDNDAILDIDEACSGLNGYYYGTNVWIYNVISTLHEAYATGPTATFVATTTDFVNGSYYLGYSDHLQRFLGDDAASLDNDPPSTRRGIIILKGYVYMQAGTYNFQVTADDGFRIKIDNEIVAIKDYNSSATTIAYPTFNVNQSGYHTIEIVYWDAGGRYALDVELREQGGSYYFLDDTITLRDCDMDKDGQTNNVDLDTDNDGLVDILEAGGTDTDFDGQVDYPIAGDPTVMNDADNDGLDDAYDTNQGGTPVPNPDTDGDGNHDFRDIDADNDGIVDYIEAQTTFGPILLSGADDDQDGIDDAYDTDDLIAIGLGGLNGTYILPINTDGTDEPDYIDTNTDNDADDDTIEAWDLNNDRIPETTPSGNDADQDGLDDAYDTNDGLADPTNGNQTAYNFPDIDTPGGDRDWREICTQLTVTKDDQLPYSPQDFNVGEDITYNIYVTNSGTVPLNNITVTDDNAEFSSSPIISTLDAYETVTLVASHTITQDDIDAGEVINQATATTDYDGVTISDDSDDTGDTGPDNGDDDPTVTLINQVPEITLLKTDGIPLLTPPDISLGQTINYQVIVKNTGNVNLTNIQITDSNATFTDTGSDTQIIASLAAGDSEVLDLTHIVTQTEIDAGYISNQALGQVSYNGITYSDASDDDDPASPSGTDDPTITIINQYPGIKVTKNDQLSGIQNMVVGDVITYEIWVTNTGNVSLGLISVSDDNAVTTSGSPINGLAPNESKRVVAEHTITQTDIDQGKVVNQATASFDFDGSTYTELSDDTDPDSPTGDHDPTVTLLVQTPQIEVTKDDGNSMVPIGYNVGDNILYNIVVTNTGNVTLTNIDVTDDNATITNSSNIATLGVGESTTITAEHEVTYADIDAGMVSNSATASTAFNNAPLSDISDDPDPGAVSGDDVPTITLIEQVPELTVLKDDGFPYPDPQNLVPGDIITYTITVTNTGNVTLSNITVTDPMAQTISGSPISTLAQGESATVLASYQVTQDDINAGQISNQAYASVEYNGTTVTDTSDDAEAAVGAADNDPTITIIGQYPELTVVKDDQLGYDPQALTVGSTITYQITVTNTGNVELHSITVDDPNATFSDSNTITVLTPGQSAILTATHTVTQDEIDAGEVVNQATASTVHNSVLVSDLSDDADLSSPSGADDPTITHIIRTPDLIVTKDDLISDSPVTPQDMAVGDAITYHIYVKNTGNITLDLINVTDDIANITSGNPITNLAPGATAMVVAEHYITQADLDAGKVENSAIASTDFDGHTYSDVSDDLDDSSPPGDDDPTITLLIQAPELAVYKDDQRSYVPQNLAVGDTINYNIYVTNTGNVSLENIVVTDDNAIISGTNVIDNLSVGATAVVEATHTVTLDDIDAGFYSNSAVASTLYNNVEISDISDDTGSTGPDNGNDDPTITLIAQNPELTLTKDDGLEYHTYDLSPGDYINYTIVITNTGNVTLTDISITDDNAENLSSNAIASLAPGDSETITATHVVTQSDVDAGLVLNSATGETSYNGQSISDVSDDADPNSPGNDDDPTVTFIGQNTALEVTKTDNLDNQPQDLSIGDNITYQIVVKNIGNVTLQNIHVTDLNAEIPAGTDLIASLDPNEIAVLTATHTITQSDIDDGLVQNSALATVNLNGTQITDLSDDPDSSEAGEDDPTITYIKQTPQLTVTKDDHLSVNVDQNLVVGDDINYTIEVTNTGNVTLPLVNLTDDEATITSGTPILDLAPGSTAVISATHTVTQEDINNGQIVNSAIASSDFNGITYTDQSDDVDPDPQPGDDDPTITNIIQTPSFVMTKTDNLDMIPQNLNVGDQITYQIVITNNGNVDLHNIQIADANASIVGLNVVASLLVGQSTSVTAVHTVNQTDINNGQVSNSATGRCLFDGQVITDTSDDTDINSPAGEDDPTITLIAQNPSLTVIKDDNYELNLSHNLHVGDVISYQITIENTGNVTLENIQVTDANAPVTSGGAISSLDPGNIANATANHIVTQEDIDAGKVVNTAVAQTTFNNETVLDLSEDPDAYSTNDPDEPTITYITQLPELTVTKDDGLDRSQPQHLNVGDEITYQIVVMNSGNVTLNNIIVTDPNATLQSSNIINELQPGESTVLTATHTVTQEEIDAGIIYNQAQAEVNYNSLQISDYSDDLDLLAPSGDDDPTVTLLYQEAAMAVTKDDNRSILVPQNLNVGDNIDYQIKVTNTGNVVLSLITLTDNNAQLGSGVPITDLFPGVTATILAQHIVTQEDIDNGVVANQVYASSSFNGQNFTVISDDPDPDATPGTERITLTYIAQNPEFVILKDDGLSYIPQNIQVNDNITYTIEVTNTGNVTLQNVDLSDANADISGSHIITEIQVGETATVTATHLVTQDDIDSGIVSNSVSGTCLFNGNDITDISDDKDINSPPNPDDPTLTFINRNPELTVTKTDNLLSTEEQNLGVDDVIIYNIEVTNSGNVNLTDITITDDNAEIAVGYETIASLAPGETVNISATHTITQADIDNGQVSNSAIATCTFDGTNISDISDDVDPVMLSGPDDPTITYLVQTPELTVTKNDNRLLNTIQNLAVNDIINYEITVTNTGNVTLQNIVVTDDNADSIDNALITSLSPGEIVNIQATHIVTQDDINNGQVVNQAIASVQYNGNTISDLSDDVDPGSPSGEDDPTITNLLQNPALEVIKDDQFDTPQNMSVNDEITYKIYVTNIGNVTLTSINLIDDNANFISSSTIADLSPGNTVVLTATHTITQADIDLGYVSNTAIASTEFNGITYSDTSDDSDPKYLGEDDPTITELVQNPGITLIKDDQIAGSYSGVNLSVNDEITYNIYVTNNGNVTLTNVVVTDDNASFVDSNTISLLAVGQTVTLQAIHTVNQQDIDSGLISNSASGTTRFNGVDYTDISDDNDTFAPPGDDDPTLTYINQNPSIILTKDDQKEYFIHHDLNVGDVITYSLLVSNTGNVTLTDLSVQDTNAETPSGNTINSLPPGYNVTMVATHEITQADIDAGQVVNSATVSTSFNGNNITDVSDDPDPYSPLSGDDDPTVTFLLQNPELTVLKNDNFTWGKPADLNVGDKIEYQILVQNTGNVNLNNIQIDDPNATISASIINTLEPGEIVTLTAYHTVTQDDINNGIVINQATASVEYNGTTIIDLSDDMDLLSPSGDDDPTETLITQNVLLTVTKDDQLTGEQNLSVGTDINYKILVTNNGNVTLDIVSISDDNANIISGNPITNLLPGHTATVLATHTVTQEDIDNGQIVNQAIATTTFNGQTYSDLSDDTDPNSPQVGDDDPTITVLHQNPSFVITKDDGLPYEDQDLNVGNDITYNIVVENNGNTTLQYIEITDDNADIVGGNNIIPSLLPNETATFTAIHTVTQLDIDAGKVVNQVSGICEFNHEEITDLSDDLDQYAPLGPDDPTITKIKRTPQLTVLKTDQLELKEQDLIVGDKIQYQITVINSGNTTLHDIQINDGNATIISGTPILTLDPGEQVIIWAEHEVTQTDIDAGVISNSAIAEALFDGTVVSDVSDDVDPQSPLGADDPTITLIAQNPQLTVTKNDQLNYTPTLLNAGEYIEYQIIVTNSGNVTLYNVVVDDPIVQFNGSSTIPVLLPGEFSILSARYMVTQDDIDYGSVSNTATATAIFDNLPIMDISDDVGSTGPDLGDSDPTVTLLEQNPSIEITKDDHLQFIPQNLTIYDKISYEILVTNTGNVTFNLAEITDQNANITSGNPITDLKPGNTVTVLAEHQVTQTDIDNGYVSNSAIVTADFMGTTYSDISDDPEENTGIGPDDPTITKLVQRPEITLMKDDGRIYEEQNLFVGDVINYQINVTNTGNVTISEDIEIEDDNAVISQNTISGLNVGESMVITGTHIVTQEDIDAGVISNSAKGTTKFGNMVIEDISDDSDEKSPAGPDDPTLTFISQTVDFELIKDDNLPWADNVLDVGDNINYTMTFINNGNVTLTNILIDDDNAIILSGNPIPTIAPGGSATITAFHKVTQLDIDAGKVVNQAIASTNFLNKVYSDLSDDSEIFAGVGNDDPTITKIKKYSGIALTKASYISTTNSICPKPGEEIIYTFEVKNTGNQTISDISVTDYQLLEDPKYISGDVDGDNKLGQNELWVFSGSYTLNQQIVDAGKFENQAYVKGIDPQNQTISDISDDPFNTNDVDIDHDGDPDDPTVTIIPQHADLILLKEGHFNDENGNGLADVGETITYTFSIQNRCNVTIKNISIEDDLIFVNPAHINLGAGAIDTKTFQGTYMITLDDINRGYVENSATAVGYDPNNNEVRDISDDPTNFEDVDLENDDEPDDPTIVRTPNVYIYEIITPNDDGLNDHFHILGIESFPNAVVKIYNRWGALVFETEAYNNQDNYWDGYSQGNDKQKLPVGTYYYVIDLGIPDIESIFTGSIYLNR